MCSKGVDMNDDSDDDLQPLTEAEHQAIAEAEPREQGEVLETLINR